jgi:Fe-S-cluster-containing dehydrogenase component
MHPEKHMVQKCDMCVPLTAQGELPNCTANCFTKARLFGDLNDPQSDVSQILAKNPQRVFRVGESLGSEPNVYYLRPKGVVIE